MIEIQFPKGFTAQEWEDLGYVEVTIKAPTRSTVVAFYSQARINDEMHDALARTGRWLDRNVVVLTPFTETEVRRFLELARESGFASFW